MRRTTKLFLMLALLLAGSVGIASAGASVFLTLDRTPSHGPPGTVVSFDGQCYWGSQTFFPGDELTVELRDPNGSVVKQQSPTLSGSMGDFSGTFKIPADAVEGEWLLFATCVSFELETDRTAERPFQVQPAEAMPAEVVNEEPTFTG